MNARNEGDPEEPRQATDGEEPRSTGRGSIPLGIGLVAVGHVAACSIIAAIGALFGESDLGVMWFLALGVTQLVHVVPLAIWLNRHDRERTTQGVWIGAGITALLAAACFGLVIASI